MRFLTALLVGVWGLLTACTTSVTTAVPAHPPDARPHALPGYIRGSKDSHADRVIVFIHGVFGDGTSTWTNPATHAYFPALIRDDKTFDGVDIWVHEFDTPKLRRTYTIDELADHLRKYLNNDNVIANHRQVIFVCHSLGGLVARAYLLKYRLPVNQVPMIYFFSTPTTGADVATLASFISANPQLTDMRKMTTDSPGTIGTWQSQWVASEYSHATLSYCGYETLPIHGVQIVQRESATNLCNTRYDPIRRDHIAIVKPADNTSDESYVAFRGAYRETFEHRQQATPVALWNLTSSDTALLRAHNLTQAPDCHSTCWSDHVGAAPGDDIILNLSYHNAGTTTAKEVRVYLNIPEDPLFGDITARLVATNTEAVFGMVTVDNSNGPVLLRPTEVWAYENSDATKTRDVPDQQHAEALTSPGGLLVGDVPPDEHQHHILVRFHCEPVTIIGMANVEDLVPIFKELRAKPIESSQKLALQKRLFDGHVDRGDIGEHTWWVPDLRDLHDDSQLGFLFFHFNDTNKVLRHLRASLALDRDDPALLRFSLYSADGPVRSATARLTYRPGTTPRLVLLGALHGPIDVDALYAIKDEEGDDPAPFYPIHDNEIELGDLPSQTMSSGMLVSCVCPPSMQAEQVAAEIVADGRAPKKQTILNGKGDVLLKMSNRPGRLASWTDYVPHFRNEWPLAFIFTFHNTGEAIARNVRLHLSLTTTADEIIARGTITAANASIRTDLARAVLSRPQPRTHFYYGHAFLYRSTADSGRPLDARQITEEGMEIGDLYPDEQGSLTLTYVVGAADSEEPSEDLLMTPDEIFETTLTFDNTTTKPLHDLMLQVHTGGGPQEVTVTTALSAGQLLRTKTVHLYSAVRSGITLRYSSAKVYTATGAKVIDASNASARAVLLGELPPGAQIVVRVAYEVLREE
jgi:pimeloyl-ACP methyl ester carboxylesterase